MKKVILILLLVVIVVVLAMVIINGFNSSSQAPLPTLPNTSDLKIVLSDKYILFE